MFESISNGFLRAFSALRGKGNLGTQDVDHVLDQVYATLIESDVSLEVAKTFTGRVRDRSLSSECLRSINPSKRVMQIVHEELVSVLGSTKSSLKFSSPSPTIVMLVGLQGSGKTSFAGKLARWLVRQGHTPALAACDLQRPAAASQLQTIAQQCGVTVFMPESQDALTVAQAAVAQAQAKQFSVLIVDTAGRMSVDRDMMGQIRAMRDSIKPHQTLLVIDAATGQESLSIARAFCDAVDVTGIVLSKLDGDARGGAALSVASLRPIVFSCIGEKIDDLEQFSPDNTARRILGMQASAEELTLSAKEILSHDVLDVSGAALDSKTSLDLNDFLNSIEQIKSMGPKILSLLPNTGSFTGMLEGREIARMQAIVQSMTTTERANPRLLNASRRLRIAAGSGTSVQDINQLIQRFEYAAKMFSSVSRSGQMPMLPGMRGGLLARSLKISRGGGKRSKRKKSR